MPTTNPQVNAPFYQFSRYWEKSSPEVKYPFVTTNETSWVYPWLDVLATNNNPDWKSKIISGQDASSPYKRRESRITVKPATAKGEFFHPGYLNETDDVICWSGVHPTPDGDLVSDSTLRDIALGRIKRRINNTTEGFQSLVPLLEIKDLRTTVKSAAQLTDSLLETLIDIKRSKGKSAFKYASKAWLTYGFGIAPMMRDVDALGKAITKFLTQEGHVDRVTGTANKTWITTSGGDSVTGGYFMPVKFVTRTQHELSYRFVAGWRFSVLGSNDYSAAARFGFTLPHLIPAIWEATAFSWVADYFGTIGAYLDDTFVGTSGQSVYIVENRLYRISSVCTIDHYGFSALNVLKNNAGFGKLEAFDFDRTVLSALPPRILRWKTTDELGLHAVTKLLNLASILVAKK